jgi:hypothetical protein
MADVVAAYDQLRTGTLNQYRGKFVAFLNSEVVGAGKDCVDLRSRLSRKLKVEPQRLAIIHVFDAMVL